MNNKSRLQFLQGFTSKKKKKKLSILAFPLLSRKGNDLGEHQIGRFLNYNGEKFERNTKK
jgi:hypothetical protein